MAKILEKDPATYSKERDGFLRDLQHFHETRGTPYRRSPTIGGREVDLYLLYTLVTAQGGWIKVNSKNNWNELLQHFNLPPKCVNGSVALKQTYLRYLDRWEKVHFLGEEVDRGSDDDEESRHKRWSARALHSVPLSYNYHQHNVVEANREYNHLSAKLYKSSDYDRLALSLLSPLPNEQDFAINVCTLLSNDGKHTLKVDKHPRIIDYLLGHAGVYNHSSLRNLFLHNYGIVRRQPIHNFWKDVLESKELLDLDLISNNSSVTEATQKPPDSDNPLGGQETCAAKSTENNLTSPSETLIVVTPMEVDVNNSVCDVEGSDSDNSEDSEIFNCGPDSPRREKRKSFKLNLDSDSGDDEMFCLRRTLGTQDYLGQRVLQIATILRNLSFIEDNVTLLSNNRTFVRFLLLCASSHWNYLKNLGLDMLGNVACEFVVKDLHVDKLASALLQIVTKGLHSQDRLWCISSLEVLNKLSQNEKNEDTLLRSLEANVYEKVCSFLTIHDVMLLIYTLECLYSLSSLGERSCNLIVNNHGVIDTLVSLVTVEGKSYGPKSCIGMKLVETVSGTAATVTSQVSCTTSTITSVPTATTIVTQSITTTCPASSITPISSCTPVAKTMSTPAVPRAISSPVKTASIAPKPITSTPVRPIQMAPQRLIAVSPSPPTPTPVPVSSSSASQGMTPQQIIQQQHAHQQAIHENEQFALAWLRATYEPSSNNRVNHQELYKHYFSSCTKIGRTGVISPMHFPRCVRSVFGGTVGPNPMKPSNPNEPQYYDGIKVRAQPLLISIQPSSIPSKVAVPKGGNSRNRKPANVVKVKQPPPAPSPTPVITVLTADSPEPIQSQLQPVSPASPILKAQLSAPPKQRDTAAPTIASSKADLKSQVMAHPHLSQALLGNSSSSSSSTATLVTMASGKEAQTASGLTNTSLIKSLLANKVNDCMTTVSMRTASDCQTVAQVAERQQRLLAQQIQPSGNANKTPIKSESLVSLKVNGARQLFTDEELADPSVSSTTTFTNSSKGKKEPPQPPPPPLAPLSCNPMRMKNSRYDNEDSDSIGNNSVASSTGLGTVGIGGISSTEDGENSLTSFEGLLNGIPNLENPLNEDSNSKDSINMAGSHEILRNKPLRLADLLEKKIEKAPPLLNGSLGKELKLGEKDLVENHIEKALNRENIDNKLDMDKGKSLKRAASDDIIESEAKKPLLAPNNVNGTTNANSPIPDAVTSSHEEEKRTSTVSNAAAKLFADMAADILEDEDEEQLLQEAQNQAADAAAIVAQNNSLSQMMVDNNQMMRQIIVSQPQLQQSSQVMITSAAQMTTGSQMKQSPQTVIVQNPGQQRTSMMLQQGNAGQILLSQGLQGQVQLVASSSQPGQYVLQTSGSPGTYMVAQPQTAMVHGQPQTVLVAQTSQQQGTGAKTIIILQQPSTNPASHHQKMVVTPQGQQMVVTQVPRPIMHSPVSNVVQQHTPTVIKSHPTVPSASHTTTLSSSSYTAERKHEDVKPAIRHKIIRDLSTPFVCEWGDCVTTTRFKSANEVYMHVCANHCPRGNEEIMCQWDRCDNMKRKRLSMMTHVHDKHCNTEAMKQSLIKRKQTSTHIGKVEPTAPASVSPHPGYAPDAALHAIKRHALEFVNPKELQLKQVKQGTPSVPVPAPKPGPPPEQDDNEGPVTKSIRLTASLILRNLVIYSSNCRRYLKHYEPHLANVALSNVESSRTIAQVLYDMNESASHR